MQQLLGREVMAVPQSEDSRALRGECWQTGQGGGKQGHHSELPEADAWGLREGRGQLQRKTLRL